MFTDLIKNSKQSENERFESNRRDAEKRGLDLLSHFSENNQWFGNYIFKSCGHSTTRQINNIRNSKGVLVCKECSDLRAQQSEVLRGLVCLGAASDGHIRKQRYKVLACGHEVDIFNGNMQKPPYNLYPCKECLTARRNKLLETLGISVVENGELGKTSLRRGHLYQEFKYSGCGHRFSALFTHLEERPRGCVECKKLESSKLNSEVDTTENPRLTGKFKTRDIPVSHKKINEAIEKGLTLISASNNRCYGYYRLPCGHNSFLHYGAVRKAKTNLFKCEPCLDLKLKAEAENVGITYIKGLFDIKKNYIRNYQFPCGHVLQLRTDNVRTGKISCTTCKEEKYKSEATERGLVLLSVGDRQSTYNYLLPCGHIKPTYLSSVRNYSWKCRECQEQRYSEEAKAAGLVMNRNVKSHHHDYRNYTLPCGCSKDISIFCVKNKSFECKTHPDRKFDFSQPISVYLIKLILQDTEVLKLGYSNEPSRRFRCYGLDGSVEVIKVIEFSNGQNAVDLERHLHEKYRHISLNSEQMSNYMGNGFTECYPLEMKDTLLKELQVLETTYKGTLKEERKPLE